MAIAGKVAITLSQENDGNWSADVAYDKLVSVVHNNNLYISRKASIGVEPPNNEYWFLALQGFSGEDVENILQQIEDIINGTTIVGNADKLDGHDSEYFAPKADLANYLPLSGGIIGDGTDHYPLVIKGNDNKRALIGFRDATNANLGYLGVYGYDNPVFAKSDSNGTSTSYALLHEGNKPSGTYTGNGSATARTIATGGIGNGIVIFSSRGLALVVGRGATGTLATGELKGLSYAEITFSQVNTGALVLATDSDLVNASGVQYFYDVI